MAATVSVSHKGKSCVLQVDLTNTVSSFQSQLEELTSVPVKNQKLLFKGKKVSAKGDDTLEIFGLKDGAKVQMLGSTVEEIGGLRAVEDEKKRTEQILRDRETQTRVRQTAFTYKFSKSIDDNIRTDIFPFESIQSFSLECKLPFPRRPTSGTPPKPRLGSVVTHETGER